MDIRSWERARRLGGAVLALTMAAACQQPAQSAGRTPGAAAQERGARSAGPGKCLGYNGLDRLNPAAEVRAGRFRTPGDDPVRVATGTDVSWGLNPYRNPTWRLWFHSLEWLGGLIKEYGRTGDRTTLTLAAGIAQDWVADNEPAGRFDQDRREAIAEGTKFRLITLICLRAHHQARWLDEAITRHAMWLARPEHYSGPWNHGTDESMILLTAGCAIGRADLADVGYQRLLDAMLRPPAGARPAIDAEGANNEQSTLYTVYNRSRWRLAFEAMRACGRAVPAELERRLALMDEFIAFQATPAGDLLQIGESYAEKVSSVGRTGNGPLTYMISRGTAGTRPSTRVRVYQAGYVMGRSGWGEHGRSFKDEMAYTARFGPGRYAHGQNDHMALTFHAYGRDLLVPSGHIGYGDPEWRAWLRSPAAHNTLVVRDAAFRQDAATSLTGHDLRPGGDFFRFSDTAFTGTTRSRSVLAASDPDALVVLDEARSGTPRLVEQLWHLPAAATALPDGTGAVATTGGVRVHFLRIPLPGTAERPAEVVRGRHTPPQGWIAPSARKALPAPVVTLAARGLQTRILTLIVPVRGDGKPAMRTATLPDGGLRVETTVSGHRLAFEAAPDGTLRRLP